MATEKAPAYQWYVKDFRSSLATRRMSFAERGVYREMLDEQWERRVLPDSPEEVADLIAMTDAQHAEVLAAWDVVRRKFVVVSGGIQNLRLEQCRREYKALKREKSAAGRASVEARRQAYGTAQPTPNTRRTDVEQPPNTPRTGGGTPPEPASALATAPASALASATAVAAVPRGVGRQPPLWRFRRFAIFRWQVEELIALVGDVEAFGPFDEWFEALDARAVAAAMVIPDPWEFVKTETLAEAHRRGLAVAVVAPTATLGKQSTRLAGALASIKAGATS